MNPNNKSLGQNFSEPSIYILVDRPFEIVFGLDMGFHTSDIEFWLILGD